MLILQGDHILLRDFAPQDWEPFLLLEGDDAMFTYMKFRIDRDSAESLRLPTVAARAGPRSQTELQPGG